MNGGLVGVDAAEENTHRRLKNSAFEMGANVVHIMRADASALGASARGEAYHCDG